MLINCILFYKNESFLFNQMVGVWMVKGTLICYI